MVRDGTTWLGFVTPPKTYPKLVIFSLVLSYYQCFMYFNDICCLGSLAGIIYNMFRKQDTWFRLEPRCSVPPQAKTFGPVERATTNCSPPQIPRPGNDFVACFGWHERLWLQRNIMFGSRRNHMAWICYAPKDLPKTRNLQLVFIVLSMFYVFQRYLLFGLTRRYHL